jgi:hypothetical protein
MTGPFVRPTKLKVKPLKDNERERIEAALTKKFLTTGLIPQIADQPDKKKSEDEKRKNRLSKALAAYTVSHLCQVSDRDGIASLVDGEEDNGIDAIHITGDTIYLVQAKYKRGEPDRDEDIHPFVQGARDLLDGNYENFEKNQLFEARKGDIEEAISAPGTQVVLVFVHMGEIVKDHALKVIDDFCREAEVTHLDINGQLIHAALLADENPKEIRAKLTLRFHRATDTTPKVAFGFISAQQLADLHHEHGSLLFDQNIRSFLGRNALNKEIETSLRAAPELFAHYNNGITMICRQLSIPRTKNRPEGQYSVRGLSIVNGAQTVGSIAQAIPRGDLHPPKAYVMVTIIETQGAGDTFAVDVTRTRNTQNPIPKEAFAAQDIVNEHLRQKLAMQEIKYVYKPGQERGDANCVLEDVAHALAMFSADPTDAFTKDVVELLNVRSPEYRRLFGTLLDDLQENRGEPERVYRKVQVYQQIERTLVEYRQATPPKSRERSFYSLMRPLTRYWVARRSRVVQSSTALILTGPEVATISRDVETFAPQVLTATLTYATEHNRGIQAISNSASDCRAIFENLEQAWRAQQRLTHLAPTATKSTEEDSP